MSDMPAWRLADLVALGAAVDESVAPEAASSLPKKERATKKAADEKAVTE